MSCFVLACGRFGFDGMPVRSTLALLLLVLSGGACSAQDEVPSRLLLKVDETAVGPFGGQKSSSCLRVYADGRTLYAAWWNSAAIITDKETGKQSRPDKTVSLEHRLTDGDASGLSDFLQSKPVKRLPEVFGPPHRPIDYVETVTAQIFGPKGIKKRVSSRGFYVASLEEKTRYPSALILLMNRIDEIEKEAVEKGHPAAIPSDCQLKP